MQLFRLKDDCNWWEIDFTNEKHVNLSLIKDPTENNEAKEQNISKVEFNDDILKL